MSRLRYNGLATGSAGSTVSLALGASLTNSATSITFNAALTHSNGTAVPTITSPDYIPLCILDTNGHVLEIVWLTAYTAAATTGTITRGKEGTTGVAHSSGDKIAHGPTVTDVGGGGAAAVRAVTHKSGSSSTLSFDVPGTAVAGDVLIGYVASGYAPSSIPTGWTQIAPTLVTLAGGNYQVPDMFVKTCVAGDIGATVNVSAGGVYDFVGLCAAVSGVTTLVSAIREAGGTGAITALSGGPVLMNTDSGTLVVQLASARGSAGTLTSNLVGSSSIDTYNASPGGDGIRSTILIGTVPTPLALPTLTSSSSVAALAFGAVALA